MFTLGFVVKVSVVATEVDVCWGVLGDFLAHCYAVVRVFC